MQSICFEANTNNDGGTNSHRPRRRSAVAGRRRDSPTSGRCCPDPTWKQRRRQEFRPPLFVRIKLVDWRAGRLRLRASWWGMTCCSCQLNPSPWTTASEREPRSEGALAKRSRTPKIPNASRFRSEVGRTSRPLHVLHFPAAVLTWTKFRFVAPKNGRVEERERGKDPRTASRILPILAMATNSAPLIRANAHGGIFSATKNARKILEPWRFWKMKWGRPLIGSADRSPDPPRFDKS
jgi:hypothetical protein